MSGNADAMAMLALLCIFVLAVFLAYLPDIVVSIVLALGNLWRWYRSRRRPPEVRKP